MTKEEYLFNFCETTCGTCSLMDPKFCYWQKIMAAAWDAAIENTKNKAYGESIEGAEEAQ